MGHWVDEVGSLSAAVARARTSLIDSTGGDESCATARPTTVTAADVAVVLREVWPTALSIPAPAPTIPSLFSLADASGGGTHTGAHEDVEAIKASKTASEDASSKIAQKRKRTEATASAAVVTAESAASASVPAEVPAAAATAAVGGGAAAAASAALSSGSASAAPAAPPPRFKLVTRAPSAAPRPAS